MLGTTTRLARTALGALALAGTLTLGGPQDKAPAGPEVGKPAPTFRLNDQTGKSVAFGGQGDHWRVLAFYPKSKTPG